MVRARRLSVARPCVGIELMSNGLDGEGRRRWALFQAVKLNTGLARKEAVCRCVGRRSEICVVAKVSPSPLGEAVLHRHYARRCPGCQFEEEATVAEIQAAEEALSRQSCRADVIAESIG